MSTFFNAKEISKDFTDASGYKVHLLEDVNLDISENSITSIVAPTGAGKSVLLKIFCGLETATSGSIEINSKKRRIIYIPSDPSSFPWYNVKENINLATSNEKLVEEAINDVGLEGYENHYPHNDSLAFRFRISLARAIASGVDFIALDEPFSRKIKPASLERLYSLILDLKEKHNLTFLLGTSNISEAVLLSDKVYAMEKDPGRIINSYNIDFQDKRNIDLMGKDNFKEYRNMIEAVLKQNNTQQLSNITL